MATYNNLTISDGSSSRYGSAATSSASTAPTYNGPGFPGNPAKSVLQPSGTVVGPFVSYGESQKGGSSETINSTKSSSALDPATTAALQALMAQLLGGGTAQQKATEAQRQQEIQSNRQQAGEYSKTAAFADAQGAMAQQMKEALAQLMPNIIRAAEGAGTSQNSLRALLTQQAASDVAGKAAGLGLQAAQNYGQIAANYAGNLEALTRPNDGTTNALLQAFQVAKGANTKETTQQTTKENSSGGYAEAPLMNFSQPTGVEKAFKSLFSSSTNPWNSYSF